MSATQLREQVVLEVAVALVTQQHSAVLYRFHSHLLTLQDLFHSGVRSLRDEFEVYASVMTPAMDSSAIDANILRAKMDQTVEQFKSIAEQEVRHFIEDSFNIQQTFKDESHRAMNEIRANERRRQDEFASALVLGRREVAATCALMKSEQAQTQTEVTALGQLRTALDNALDELNKYRAEAEVARTKVELELLNLRRQHDAERAEWHATLNAERDAAAQQMKLLVAEGDAARRQHLAELAQVSNSAAETVDNARRDLSRMSSLLTEAQRECDDARRELADEHKRNASERLEMQKTIAGLEFEVEKIRLLLDAERSDTTAASIELRRSVEARKNAEVEEFKRRLIGSIAAPAHGSHSASQAPLTSRSVTAYSPNGGHAAAADTSSPLQSTRRAMDAARGASINQSPRSPSYYGGASGSPAASARGPSLGDASVSARSPSDTFLRLQQLSSNWKDRLAGL